MHRSLDSAVLSVSYSKLLCCTPSLSLSRVYEEHVLATGSLDERIFTGEGASEDIGTPGPCLCEGVENQDSATYRLHTSLTVRKHTYVPMFASFKAGSLKQLLLFVSFLLLLLFIAVK